MSLKCSSLLISTFVFYFLFQSVIAAQDSLLNELVTAKFKNIPLKKAFKTIEEQLNCYFTYEGSNVNPEKKINHSFKSVPLRICLEKMLDDTSLSYKVIDNHIIIKKKRAPRLEVVITDSLPQFFVVKGRVIDKHGDGALPYASVNLKGFSLGAICNMQGEFVLKVPRHLINEQINISYLGFKNLLLPINQCVDSFKVFQLERSYIAIQEVIIRKKDAKALIRTALSKIELNYNNHPSYLTGFYRESVKRNNDYMFISEAVVKVYKTSYTKRNDLDFIKVLKSRKMQDVRPEDTIALKLKSGLSSCLDLDLVKNQNEFLTEENFDLYNYIMADIVTFNDRNAYLIEFEPKKDIGLGLFEGKVYIDIEKLAIIGAEFSVNPQKVLQTQGNYIVRKDRGIRIRMSDINYVVNYRLINDKYYLNYVRGFLKMKLKKKGKLFPIDFETTLEMAINEVDTLNVERFKRNEIDNPYTIFFDDVYEYDEAFWEDYNFLKPDEPLEQSIRKLYKAKN